MKLATDKYQCEELTKAGFNVAPDLMWMYTTEKDRTNPYLTSYDSKLKKSRLFICPAWSLGLLLESVPKFTSYGVFAIRYNHRVNCFFVGYQDDDGAFTKAFPLDDLCDSVFYTIRWTLKNPEEVAIGEAYLKGGEQ